MKRLTTLALLSVLLGILMTLSSCGKDELDTEEETAVSDNYYVKKSMLKFSIYGLQQTFLYITGISLLR